MVWTVFVGVADGGGSTEGEGRGTGGRDGGEGGGTEGVLGGGGEGDLDGGDTGGARGVFGGGEAIFSIVFEGISICSLVSSSTVSLEPNTAFMEGTSGILLFFNFTNFNSWDIRSKVE